MIRTRKEFLSMFMMIHGLYSIIYCSCRWIEGNKLLNVDTYKNWSTGSPVDNTQSRDCVQFSADGWRVHIGFCETSNLPFLCRQQGMKSIVFYYILLHCCLSTACNSTNGVSCVVPVQEPFPIGIIIAIVLVALVIAVVVAVLLILLWLWKYRNDTFYRYVCCCLQGRAKGQVHSLQQENQRLRHELSQQKLGMALGPELHTVELQAVDKHNEVVCSKIQLNIPCSA